MCGLAGFVGPEEPDLLESMRRAVAHRGPDQEGSFTSAACSLVHKRLAILDLSEAARQPMQDQSGRFTLVYNGELYNFRDLRSRYQARGWSFRTESDAECFLASAALNDLSDLRDFHGMFAFALWDAREHRLLLARDRMGIKPLYVFQDGERFYFASEIPALLEARRAFPLDAESRAIYLLVGYVPEPRTIYRGISALEPGHLYRISSGSLSDLGGFANGAAPRTLSWKEALAAIPESVDRVVSRQMVSDRPIGLFLSGGLDSSVVLSAMAAAGASPIRTFTTRFVYRSDNPRFNLDADLACKLAKKYGSEHHEIEIRPRELSGNAEPMAFHLAQPNNNFSLFVTDVAGREASRWVPVVLSGDGGDEVFGGYERYRLYSRIAPFLSSRLSRGALRIALKALGRGQVFRDLLEASDEPERILSFYYLPAEVRASLFGAEAEETAAVREWRERLSSIASRSHAARLMALDRATWLRDAFARSDRLTMRHGLEMRVPLVDDELVQLAQSVPASALVTRSETKKLWRTAFHDRCLPETREGVKRGWSAPTGKWLRNELRDWVEDILSEAIRDHPWMNATTVRQMWQEHLETRRYRLTELWTVVGYQLWWRAFRAHLSD